MTLLLLKNIIFTFYFYSSTLVKAKAMHNCEAQSHVKEPLVNTINKFSFLTYLCHLLFLTSKPVQFCSTCYLIECHGGRCLVTGRLCHFIESLYPQIILIKLSRGEE